MCNLKWRLYVNHIIPNNRKYAIIISYYTLPAIWETQVQLLGWEDPLEKGMATHSSILAWRTPWTKEPCELQSMKSQRVGHDRATNSSLHFLPNLIGPESLLCLHISCSYFKNTSMNTLRVIILQYISILNQHYTP